MMNGILTALLVFSVVTAAFTGRMEALSAAALSGCGEAVSLVITLTGMLCLWSGLMEIARRCRLTEALARLLHPLTRWLFPTVPQGSPAMQAICMNLSANLLGLGNAATPLGLAAMRELQKLNPHKDSASNAMVTFVAMNTASLQLIPTTCAALRQQAGSAAPMEILPAPQDISRVKGKVGQLRGQNLRGGLQLLLHCVPVQCGLSLRGVADAGAKAKAKCQSDCE